MESMTQDEEEENIFLGRAEMKDLQHVCDGEIHNIALDLQGYSVTDHSRLFLERGLAW